jgi:glycosyltransferase involved in cell wall biosynthesis
MTDQFPEGEIFFSIVMPVFNGGRFIGEALKSVLSQEFGNTEIVITDGGSTDNTEEIIKSFNDKRIRYSTGRDFGLNHAVNKGLLLARGKYILWLNSDDYLYEGALQEVYEILKKQEIDVLYASADHVDVKGKVIRRHPTMPFDYKELVNRKNFIATQACFFRREILSHVGLFDCTLTWCGDWDMWKRIAAAKKYRFYYLDKPLAAWRHHLDTITSRGGSKELYQRSVEVIKNSRKYSTAFLSSIEIQNIPYLLVGFLRLREVWRKLRKTHA